MTLKNITFLDQFIPNSMFVSNNSIKTRIYFNDTFEIIQLLNTLDTDQIYVVELEFVVSWLQYEEDYPIIKLSKPFLISKNSNPQVISNFIKNRVILTCDLYYLDRNILEFEDKSDSPGVIINYTKINLF